MLKNGLITHPELAGAKDLERTLAAHQLQEGWPEILAALDFAKSAHLGQKRDDGSDYFHHCVRTAMIAVDTFGVRDASAIKAAILHDTLEDTGVTSDVIARQFGPTTERYVSLLSKPKRLPDESYDQRNARYLERLEASDLPDAVALKLADRTDNINDAHLMPQLDKVKRYLGDTRRHYIPLYQRHFPNLADDFRAKVDRSDAWLSQHTS